MALVELPGTGIVYPPAGGSFNAPAYNSGAATIDDTAEKVGFMIRCPKDGTLNRVGFSIGAVTQNPTNGLKVSFQGLGTDGNPDGTPTHYCNVPTGSIAANTWVQTGLLTSDGTDTGTKKTVTAGQEIAIVVEFESFVASDSLAINRLSTGPWVNNTTPFHPTCAHFTASWSKQGGSLLTLAIQYDDNVWTPVAGLLPGSANLAVSTTSSSTPDVYALKFVAPVAMRAKGFVLHTYFQNNAATCTVYLYDSTTTALATATVADPDIFHALNSSGPVFLPFDAVADSVTLVAGATYRIAMEATSTGQIRAHGYSFPTGMGTAMPGGETAIGSTRKDSGAWTDTSTNSYAFGLQIDAIDVPAGGNLIVRRFYED